MLFFLGGGEEVVVNGRLEGYCVANTRFAMIGFWECGEEMYKPSMYHLSDLMIYSRLPLSTPPPLIEEHPVDPPK